MGTRRAGIAVLAGAVILALVAFFLAQSYVSSAALSADPPKQPVAVAADDIAPGSPVTPAMARSVAMSVPPELYRSVFLVPGDAVKGVAVRAIKKGEPILAGDLAPLESAQSIAPLVPLKTKVGTVTADVVGGLNLPLGRLVAPPPAVRPHDRIDLWAGGTGPNQPSLQLVLENVEILAFNGDATAPSGFDIAVTVEQLDRFFFFSVQGAPLLVTVRSSQAPPN